VDGGGEGARKPPGLEDENGRRQKGVDPAGTKVSRNTIKKSGRVVSAGRVSPPGGDEKKEEVIVGKSPEQCECFLGGKELPGWTLIA